MSLVGAFAVSILLWVGIISGGRLVLNAVGPTDEIRTASIIAN